VRSILEIFPSNLEDRSALAEMKLFQWDFLGDVHKIEFSKFVQQAFRWKSVKAKQPMIPITTNRFLTLLPEDSPHEIPLLTV
jgi:hypothetical protein